MASLPMLRYTQRALFPPQHHNATAPRSDEVDETDAPPRPALGTVYEGLPQGRDVLMNAMPAFDQLQLRFVDHIQWRYEVRRPFVLFDDWPAPQRAAETHTHPETVRKLTRRFRHQGTLGLFPEHPEVTRPRPGQPLPAVVVEELTRLKALSQGCGYRALARIIPYICNARIDDKTVKKLWQQRPLPVQGEFPLGISHSQADRSHTRRQVIKLSAQGWSTGSISAFVQVSRPTVTLWIRRFEAAHWAGLEDKSRAPTSPARKVWLPLMIEVYHLPKRHPDAGRFRLWSLRDRDDIAVRTVGRVMALNKQG